MINCPTWFLHLHSILNNIKFRICNKRHITDMPTFKIRYFRDLKKFYVTKNWIKQNKLKQI